MAERYVHDPLVGEDYIRLLRIDSVSETEIHCTMCQRQRPLEQAESNYAAVSYCWGDNSTNKIILIDGKPFEVTSNLFNGMRSMHQNINPLSVWFWIDAICIDQTNNTEKAAQVQRMDTTYRNARMVVVWLGEEADNSSSVMRVLKWLSARGKLTHRVAFRETGDLDLMAFRLEQDENIPEASLIALEEYLEHFGETWLDRSMEKALLERESIKTAILAPDHPWWRDFLLLVNRPWFFRVWTFQEIMLASHALILCGDDFVDWNVMRRCRAVLQRPSAMIDVEKRPGIVDPSSPMSDVYFGIKVFDGLKTLRICLGGLPGRDAKDPRDFIYGYLGLCGKELASSIIVDYEAPASRVFRDALILAIQGPRGAEFWAHHIGFFFAAAAQPRVSDLPSWCPDLTSQPRIGYRSLFNAGESIARTVRNLPFDYPVEVSDDPSCIRIYGAPLDTVVGVSKQSVPGPVREKDAREVMSVIKPWLDAIEDMFSTCDNRASLIEIWLQSYFNWAASVSHAKQIYTLDYLRQISVNLEFGKDYGDCFDLLVSANWSNFDAKNLITDLAMSVHSSRGRYFFITEHGRIGFAPKRIQVGQQICYFPGGGQLHVLSSGYDECIACCWVDGLMGDALLPILSDEGLRPFELH